MTLVQILLCSFVALTMGAGQVLMKLAAGAWNRANGDILAFVLSPALIAALVTYGISAFAWIFVLRSAPLSRAYVFALMGSALVPFLAWAVFKEPLTPRYLIGFALVLAGLYVSLAGKPVV